MCEIDTCNEWGTKHSRRGSAESGMFCHPWVAGIDLTQSRCCGFFVSLTHFVDVFEFKTRQYYCLTLSAHVPFKWPSLTGDVTAPDCDVIMHAVRHVVTIWHFEIENRNLRPNAFALYLTLYTVSSNRIMNIWIECYVGIRRRLSVNQTLKLLIIG